MYFNNNRSAFLNYLFIFLSRIVEVPVFIILVFVFLWFNLRTSFQIGLSGILSLVFSLSLKQLFAHPRPMLCFEDAGILETIQQIPFNTPELGLTSFPSGHSTAAFALMLTFAIIYKINWISILVALTAIGTAISRIYLLNHFLEDIIAGSLLGIYIAFVVAKIADYFEISTSSILKIRS